LSIITLVGEIVTERADSMASASSPQVTEPVHVGAEVKVPVVEAP
jgi:hypothetical protein